MTFLNPCYFFFLFSAISGVYSADVILYVTPNFGTDGNCSLENPCNVTSALSVAKEGCTILFLAGTYTIQQPLQITSNNISFSSVLRDANSVVITSWGQESCFRATNLDLIQFSMLTFSHCGGGQSSGIELSNITLIAFSDCVFTQNNELADEFKTGGAINLSSSNTSIINCSFVMNRASQGGAIAQHGGSILIVASLFSQNMAESNGAVAASGGAVLFQSLSNVTLINSSFLLNSVLSSNKTANLEESSCRAPPPNSGGAIFASNNSYFIFQSCRLVNNTASGYTSTGDSTSTAGDALGGALYLFGGISLMITHTDFQANSAMGGKSTSTPGACGSAFGGAIYVDSTSTVFISSGSFGWNRVEGGDCPQDGGTGGDVGGGASRFVDIITQMTIHNITYHDNVAQGGAGASSGSSYGGSIFFSQNPNLPPIALGFIIQDSYFASSDALGAPPPVRIKGSRVGFKDSKLVSGGSIRIDACCSNFLILRTRFELNHAIGSVSTGMTARGDASGGSMSILDQNCTCCGKNSSVLNIDSCDFFQNIALGGTGVVGGYAQGGGLLVALSQTAITNIENSTFVENTAVGGQATSRYTPTSLQYFEGNAMGGAIYFAGSQNSLLNCSFINNNVELQPGESSISESKLFLGRVFGGAVYLNVYHDCPHIDIFQTSFVNNSARIRLSGVSGRASGGAIYLSCDVPFPGFSARMTLNKSVFEGNSILYAPEFSNPTQPGPLLQGGALSIDQREAFVRLSDCYFLSNSAPGGDGGSVFDISECVAVYENCFFQGSTTVDRAVISSSVGRGGSLQFMTGPRIFVNSSISASSSDYGGGVYFEHFICRYSVLHSIPLNRSFNYGNVSTISFDHNSASLGGGDLFFESWDPNSVPTMIDMTHQLMNVSRNQNATYGLYSSSPPVQLDCFQDELYVWSGMDIIIFCQIQDVFGNPIRNPAYWVYFNPLEYGSHVLNQGQDLVSPNPTDSLYTFSLQIQDPPPSAFILTFSVQLNAQRSPPYQNLTFQTTVMVLPCPPGYSPQYPQNDTVICSPCGPRAYNFDGANCDCEECFCSMNVPFLPCLTPPNSQSPSNLSVVSGYWPHPAWLQPQELIPCKIVSACLPFTCTIEPASPMISWVVNCSGLSGLPSACSPGYTNRLCSECEKGWYEVGGKLCLECRSNTTWVIPFILVGLLCLVITLAFRQNLLTTLVEIILAVGGYLIDLTPLWVLFLPILIGVISLINAKIKKAPVGTEPPHETSPLSAGIVKSFLFYSQFTKYLLGSNTLGSAFGSSGGGMLAILKITGIECVVPSLFGSYLGRFSLYLFLPFLGLIIAVLVLLLEWIISKIKYWYRKRSVMSNVSSPIYGNSSSEIDDSPAHLLDPVLPQMSLEGRQFDGHQFNWSDSIRRVSHGFLFYCFLIYTDLSDKLFQVTNCDEYGYIEEVPYIRCAPPIGSPDFSPGGVLFICAMVYLLLFTIGLPLSVALILYSHRHTLLSPETEQSLGFLYEAFRPRMYLWGIFGFARSFILLCLIIYVPAPSPAYLLSVTFALCLFLLIQQWMKPFLTSLENWIEQLSILALLILHVAAQYSAAIDVDRLGSSLKNFTPSQMFIFIFNVFCIVSYLAALLLPTWKGLSSRMQRCCQNAEPQANEAAEQNEQPPGYASLLQTTDSESE